MSWSEVFILFVVCHLAGDFLLQTEFQAVNKHGGLGPDARNRRALRLHVMTYSLPFVPATLVIAHDEHSALPWLALLLVMVAHFVQDDGRLLKRYVARVKKTNPPPGSALWITIDQSFHIVTLFFLALVATA
jgi:hypothetical protein